MLPNVPAFPAVFYGSLLAGCMAVPMNPLFKAGEVEFCREDCGAKLLFVWDGAGDEARKAAEHVGVQVITVAATGLDARQLDDLQPLAPVERTGDDTAVTLHLRHIGSTERRRADTREPGRQRRNNRRDPARGDICRCRDGAACRCSTSSD